jgi:hypothetical protein
LAIAVLNKYISNAGQEEPEQAKWYLKSTLYTETNIQVSWIEHDLIPAFEIYLFKTAIANGERD